MVVVCCDRTAGVSLNLVSPLAADRNNGENKEKALRH
jgi:hypothetical protein